MADTPAKKIPIHLQSAATRLLIKGGKVVNDDHMIDADVYIEEGIIKDVGKNLVVPGGAKVIDAKGKLVMPGGIDPHTHFQMPFMGTCTIDDFYSGTKAALAGGTTMVIDFVLEPGSSLVDAYNKWRQWADPKVCCDYGLHVAVTGINDKTEEEMKLLTSEQGVNSFKFFMNYENMRLSDAKLLKGFTLCRKYGAIAQVHAENGDIVAYNQANLIDAGITGPEGHYYSQTEESEAEATNRAITISNEVNCPLYVVHCMSKSAGDIIAKHKQNGVNVYGETIAAAIGSDGRNYFSKNWRHAAAHVMSPPLRADPTTSSHLLELLSSGSLQVTGSDHCTFTSDQKALGANDFRKIPNGVNGVEERMSVLWEKGVMNGILDPSKFVAVTSSNAAKIFNIYPQKGRIQVGSDADIVVWDPSVTRVISAKTHNSKTDFNIFQGMTVRGAPSHVVARGRVVVEDNELHVIQGSGKFIPTYPFSQFLYASLQQRPELPAAVDRSGDSNDTDSTCIPPVPVGSTGVPELFSPKSQASDEFHVRPPTKSGGRNMQDSSFSLSGAQIDDSKGQKLCVKVNRPPGGFSAGLWALFRYKGAEIVHDSSGIKLEELRQTLTDDERAFAFVRVSAGDEMSKRKKFVLLTWIGSGVGTLKRARVSIDKALVKQVIQNFAVELQLESPDELTEDFLRSQVDKVGGANYGTGVRN